MSDAAETLIHWKGTDVCMDFHCTCGAHSHFDGDFCYVYKCPSCGRRWKMPTELELQPASDDDPGTERTGWTDGDIESDGAGVVGPLGAGHVHAHAASLSGASPGLAGLLTTKSSFSEFNDSSEEGEGHG